MQITGIVAEYNPFHNGHLYQVEQTKKLTGCDKIIAVMSGNFSQRANPCVADKYTRTRMALCSGVDMVLELPVPFATASAERFCEAAISVFHKSNIVDNLSFGSEVDDIDLMYQIAKVLSNEPDQFKEILQSYLKEGLSYPRSRELALIDFFKNNLAHVDLLQAVMNNPNNILGIEYIKALIKYNSNIKPYTIKRKTSHYHDQSIYSSIASATAIRAQLKQHNIEDIAQAMPKSSFDLLMSLESLPPSLDDYSMILHHKLIFSTLDDLYSLWDIPKNLCHSIMNMHHEYFGINELVNQLTSKTYSRATVQRALLRILLDINQKDMDTFKSVDWIPYIRVLGCKKDSLSLLSRLSQASSVPVITNLGKAYPTLSSECQLLLDYEIHSTSLYALGNHSPSKFKQDFSQSFIII